MRILLTGVVLAFTVPAFGQEPPLPCVQNQGLMIAPNIPDLTVTCYNVRPGMPTEVFYSVQRGVTDTPPTNPQHFDMVNGVIYSECTVTGTANPTTEPAYLRWNCSRTRPIGKEEMERISAQDKKDGISFVQLTRPRAEIMKGLVTVQARPARLRNVPAIPPNVGPADTTDATKKTTAKPGG